MVTQMISRSMILAGHADAVNRVAIDPQLGCWLVSAGDDNTVRLWSINTESDVSPCL